MNLPLAVVIPAAGVGKRMQSQIPKQYLKIANKTVLEHTIDKFLAIGQIDKIVVCVSEQDPYWPVLSKQYGQKIVTVIGGSERADSVLAGLNSLNATQYPWSLVHDAARPCVPNADILHLIKQCLSSGIGGLLASPVRDTMKRSNEFNQVQKTEERAFLWHALTPQMYPTEQLKQALTDALAANVKITDESSAIEWKGWASQLIEADESNIKITRPSDLQLAAFFLENHK